MVEELRVGLFAQRRLGTAYPVSEKGHQGHRRTAVTAPHYPASAEAAVFETARRSSISRWKSSTESNDRYTDAKRR